MVSRFAPSRSQITNVGRTKNEKHWSFSFRIISERKHLAAPPVPCHTNLSKRGREQSLGWRTTRIPGRFPPPLRQSSPVSTLSFQIFEPAELDPC